ncbi:NAD(P)/FAD-dependent oxidoreductase [Pseudonocardia hydrocarbonoxydans]|uniref:NAD(P)/FAD-dependent oxidoreductase n=1 Tax=Pseudonocardia hydrocarbonoxydans TaxID=76726 RepID=UPI0031DA1802
MNRSAHLVAGAGPAGLVAAATLARAGQPVTVLERHPQVGHRFHGDFQGLENWSHPADVLDRLAALGVTADFGYRPFHEVTFYDSRLRPTSARTERPLFYLVRRGGEPDSLDSALLRQARDAGAEVRFGETVRTIGPRGIVATGPRAANVIAAGYTFPARLPDQAHAIVSRRLAPGGYAYLLVWDGRATLATCMFRDLERWRAALDATVAAFTRLVPGLDLSQARPFGGHGGVLGAARYTDEGGRLYAGEAAGLQDPEWGFGMVHAMRSGALAATSLLDATDYAAAARARFDPAHRAGFANRMLFEALPERLADALLRREAHRPDLRDRMTRHWAPDPVKNLAAPLAIRAIGRRLPTADTSCHEPTCTCVRCRHGRRGAAAA